MPAVVEVGALSPALTLLGHVVELVHPLHTGVVQHVVVTVHAGGGGELSWIFGVLLPHVES